MNLCGDILKIKCLTLNPLVSDNKGNYTTELSYINAEKISVFYLVSMPVLIYIGVSDYPFILFERNFTLLAKYQDSGQLKERIHIPNNFILSFRKLFFLC